MSKIGILAGYTASTSPLMETCDFIDYYTLIARVGEREFRHGDISVKDYFDLINQGKDIPKTSQPSTQYFKDIIKNTANKYDYLFVVTLNKHFSGTYQSACMLVEELGLTDKVYVIDSESTTLSETVLIDTIIKEVNANKNIETIKKHINFIRKNEQTLLFPADFKYLKHSGRISGIQSLLGTMLNMRVFVKVDETGAVNVVGKGRGNASVLKFLDKLIKENHYTHVYYSRILISEETDKQVLSFLEAQGLNIVDCKTDDVVPVTHFGPNTFGVCFYKDCEEC